ncbi:MAG: hypothetical protein V5A77_04995, partial [Candidatus Bipolaricaulota bacterium]
LPTLFGSEMSVIRNNYISLPIPSAPYLAAGLPPLLRLKGYISCQVRGEMPDIDVRRGGRIELR